MNSRLLTIAISALSLLLGMTTCLNAHEIEVVNWGADPIFVAYAFKKEVVVSWAGGSDINNSDVTVGWYTIQPKSSQKLKIPGGGVRIHVECKGKNVVFPKLKTCEHYVHPVKPFEYSVTGWSAGSRPYGQYSLERGPKHDFGRGGLHLEQLGMRKAIFAEVPDNMVKLDINR